MNALCMIWSGVDTNLRCASLHIGGKNISEKNGKCKERGIGWQNASKDSRKSWDIG